MSANRPRTETVTPAQATAHAYLLAALPAPATGSRMRLPSIRRLAAGAGVSYHTMWRAVRRLSARSGLTTVRGSGTWAGRVGGPAEVGPPPGPCEYRWQQVARRLRSDIREGAFHRAGTLPSRKALQQRYGVDYRTLRKALADLTARSLLARQRREYRIVRPQRLHAGNAVVFITPTGLLGTSRVGVGLHSLFDVVRMLESECSRRGLRFIPGHVYGGRADVGSLLRRETPYGVIVYLPAPGMLESALRLVPHVPVAIFDNYAGYRLAHADWFRAHRQALSLQIDQHAVGRDAGGHLLRCGHQCVAFISPYIGREFATWRLEGLREVAGHGVIVCADNEGSASSPLTQEALEALPEDQVPESLARLFDRAMRTPDVTAWVCVNDAVAVRALRYLERSRVRVPSGLSVIGFDNSVDAALHRLTTYDFDLPGICLAMLDHLVDPEPRAAQPPERRVAMRTGMVIERETVAHPDRASTARA